MRKTIFWVVQQFSAGDWHIVGALFYKGQRFLGHGAAVFKSRNEAREARDRLRKSLIHPGRSSANFPFRVRKLSDVI